VKLISPETREANASRASGPKILSLAEILKEKHLTPYIMLACEHYTSREEIEFYSVWSPGRGKYYCTQCGKWKRKKVVKRTPTPDVPMF
jgi:hypothetical protein